MPRIVIEPERSGVSARITLIELSDTDSVYSLHCTGDGIDECPTAGFAPGDTWGNGMEDALQAGEVHMLAHERRVCVECTGRTTPTAKPGWVICTRCGYVEGIS